MKHSTQKLPRGFALNYAFTAPGTLTYRIVHEAKEWRFAPFDLFTGLARPDQRQQDIARLAYFPPDIPQTVRDAAIKVLIEAEGGVITAGF